MSMPPIPPPLESLGNRPFSFYPAILNIEHNEWQYKKATWSEILVVNRNTGMEVWIPRRFLGELSRIDEPVVIVGLNKELEYKGGSVWPYQRRVIQMPMAVGERPRTAAGVEPNPVPAPVVGIRLESGAESRIGRMIALTMVVGILVCFFAISLYRGAALRPKVVFTTRDQSYLELTGRDDYYAVVQKLGDPAGDRWMSETGELQYRALSYPQKGFTVILMGTDRRQAKYIGTMNDNWVPVHSVDFRTGGNTFSMLRELKKF